VLRNGATIDSSKSQGRGQLMSIPDSPRETPAPQLAQCEEELNKTTAGRIAKNEAVKWLPAVQRATEAAQQLKQLAGMAGWAGDIETEDSLRLALQALARAASI